MMWFLKEYVGFHREDLAYTYLDFRGCFGTCSWAADCDLFGDVFLWLVSQRMNQRYTISRCCLLTIDRRSLFYGAAIIMGVTAFLCLGMQESRPSKILRNEKKTIAHKTSFDRLSVEDSEETPDAKTFVRTTLVMPIRLFFTEPIVFFTSIMAATVYGVTYLFVSPLYPPIPKTENLSLRCHCRRKPST